jgi:hypothetical protein
MSYAFLGFEVATYSACGEVKGFALPSARLLFLSGATFGALTAMSIVGFQNYVGKGKYEYMPE